MTAYLVSRGTFRSRAGLNVRVLGGGVSNVVLGVRGNDRNVVVKQALPRLRVPDEWLAKRERALTEADALRLAERIAPGCVPGVLDVDPAACALSIEEAPESWRPWKDVLLDGEAEPAIARRLGELLAALHTQTFGDHRVARTFDDLEAFDQLRIDPYYRTVARRHPDLAAAVEAFVTRMEATHVCLVHGDYSPKNVLVGDRVWVIDFEVAHFGDPAFDLAFMLDHLLLKRLHVSPAAGAIEDCASAFLDAYCAAVPAGLLPDDPLRPRARRLPDGRPGRRQFPAEYLSPPSATAPEPPARS